MLSGRLEGIPDLSGTIAAVNLVCIHPSGRKGNLTIEVGLPYQVCTEDAACRVAIIGLYDHLADMHGVDILQALCLALRLARTLLQDFEARGGQLYYSENETERVSADLLFGDFTSESSADAA